MELLDSAPGVDKKAAEIVLAEMGIDMTQFATADHLAAWAGLAPGNNKSGSKRHKAADRMARSCAGPGEPGPEGSGDFPFAG